MVTREHAVYVILSLSANMSTSKQQTILNDAEDVASYCPAAFRTPSARHPERRDTTVVNRVRLGSKIAFAVSPVETCLLKLSGGHDRCRTPLGDNGDVLGAVSGAVHSCH